MKPSFFGVGEGSAQLLMQFTLRVIRRQPHEFRARAGTWIARAVLGRNLNPQRRQAARRQTRTGRYEVQEAGTVRDGHGDQFVQQHQERLALLVVACALLVGDELDVLLQRVLVPIDATLATKHHLHLRRAENLKRGERKDVVDAGAERLDLSPHPRIKPKDRHQLDVLVQIFHLQRPICPAGTQRRARQRVFERGAR